MEIMLIEAEKREIDLILNVDSSVPDKIIGDQLRLRQIVVNILSNAVKFSSKNEIVIRANTTANSEDKLLIEISVEDHGVGIPENAQPILFHQFSQADTSITRRYVSLFC